MTERRMLNDVFDCGDWAFFAFQDDGVAKSPSGGPVGSSIQDREGAALSGPAVQPSARDGWEGWQSATAMVPVAPNLIASAADPAESLSLSLRLASLENALVGLVRMMEGVSASAGDPPYGI